MLRPATRASQQQQSERTRICAEPCPCPSEVHELSIAGVDADSRIYRLSLITRCLPTSQQGFAGRSSRRFPARRRVLREHRLTSTQCLIWDWALKSSGNETVGSLGLLPTTAPASRSLLLPKACSRGTLRAPGRSHLLLELVTTPSYQYRSGGSLLVDKSEGVSMADVPFGVLASAP